MRHRLARTSAEAQIYMQLHPCGSCGERAAPAEHAVIDVDGEPAVRYAGPCSRCGREREFTFRSEVFGDGDHSELLDPGQWLWLAESLASGVPAQPDDLPAPEHAQARADLLLAVAAVTEAMRFAPAGADAVPAEAFWSEQGRGVYVRDPGQFRRSRLELVRQTYQEIADRFA